MENYSGSAMKINCVIADSVASDVTIDINSLKNVGPIWGGWKTWRSCQTDNVICHNDADARNLISKNFHQRCNMYLPNSKYQELGRPAGVKLYQGDFHLDVDHPDEIVAMHLASQNSDIVLMIGFNLSVRVLDSKLSQHNWHVYKNYVRQIINDSPDVQWVLLDHPTDIELEFKKLPNLQFDSLETVVAQFG